jgi:hypothetical protein
MLHKEERIRLPGRRVAAVRKTRVLISALAVFAVSPVFGANICEGKVTYLGMNSVGFVTVSVGGFGVWYICNPGTSFAGNGGVTYTPEGCRAWFATILAAQKSGTAIRFYFESSASTHNGPECVALGSWTYPSPAPYHLQSFD